MFGAPPEGGTSLPSYSEGIAYPNHLSSIAAPDGEAVTPTTLPYPHPTDISLGELITTRIADAQAQNAADGQRGRSYALVGRHPALVWQTRPQWITRTAAELACEPGRQLCRQRHLSPRTAMFVARATAQLADSRTGRGVTASNETIGRLAAELAGRAKPFSHDVVSNARAVFAALGLAVEVAKGRYLTAQERFLAAVHHDGVQLRAASTWALTSPRRWYTKSYLPRRGSTGSITPRRKYSPSTRKRAQAPSGRCTKTHRSPRPLSAQLVTAQLVQRAHGLDNGRHLGTLVDVINELVDCDRWTGSDLAALLDDDARTNPRDWPDHIVHPAAFLRYRLTRLAGRLAGPSPSQLEAERHQAAQQEQRDRKEQARRDAENRASATHVAETMATIRQQLINRRHSRDTSASSEK